MALPRPHAEPPSSPVHPFDQRHGTDTSGLLPGRVIAAGTGIPPAELTAYYGVAPSILAGVIDLWLRACSPGASIEDTVFLDVGAGKGRAMMLASQYPFLRVEGVELNPQLAAIAHANFARWGSDPAANALAPLRLHQADATRHPLPPEPTLAYLFHPFEGKLLRRFLRLVTGSLASNPHAFDLVYVNAEHNSMLDRHPSLRRLWFGNIPMSAEDHTADMAAIAQQKEYGSTGDELCAIYRVLTTGT